MNLPPQLAWSATLVVALSFTGCNLAPKYARPVIDPPAHYGEANAAATSPDGVAWDIAQPRDQLRRGRWWELYHDPALDALEEQVQISNQSIRAAEANFRAARAAVGVARGAFFPLVSVAPAFSRSHGSGNVENASGTLPNPTRPAGINEYSLPFDASYEFDLWGRVRNSVAASAASAQASAADLATAQLSTQAELAQDYFQLRALDAQRQIIGNTVASYRQSLEQTQALYRTGLDSEEEVARAETQLNTAIAQATDLGVARAAYQHAIAVLIGKAPATFSLAAMPLTARPPLVPAGLPADLLQRRPDIAAAERRVAAANAQIGVARAAWFPRLTLGAAAGWQSSAAAQWFEWPSRFWSVGPQLAEVLFIGPARGAQAEQARAALDQATAAYRQTVLAAFQAVEDNLAAVRILDQEASEQRRAVASAQHLLDLANTRFNLGIDSYLNVITAQTALLSNRQTEVQIQVRQMVASIALVKALGGGWTTAELPTLGRSAGATTAPRTPGHG
jgi:NodT family efflux transporter outer membrane factor (OMF) lipoprotein